MNKRQTARQVIIAEVAQTGIAGRCSIRAYIETRMSKATFNQACEIGQRVFERKQIKLPPHLQAIADKTKNHCIEDVTPEGYGPAIQN